MRLGVLEGRAAASLHGVPRVGFIVPRHGQTAVARNRLKRRLRELARLELLPVLGSVDVVIRATPPAYGRDFGALQREVRQLAQRLRPSAREHAP